MNSMKRDRWEVRPVEETPESYLEILASPFAPVDPPKRSVKSKQDKELLNFLDALATICVSQSGEGYATAIANDSTGCTIFVVGNQEEVPLKTQRYLANVCQQMSNIANQIETFSPGRTPSSKELPPDIRQLIRDLKKTIFTFTYDKFFARVTKYLDNEAWTSCVGSITSAIDENGQAGFNDAIDAFNLLHNLTITFNQATITGGDSDCAMNAVIKQLDYIHQTWGIGYARRYLNISKQDLAFGSDFGPLLHIVRYLQKILKIHRALACLIQHTKSHRHQALFKIQPKLVFLQSTRRPMKLDRKEAFEMIYTKTEEDELFLQGIYENPTIDIGISTAFPHCECAMMFEILRLRETTMQQPETTIGVSSVSCIGCHLYFEAYQKAQQWLGPPLVTYDYDSLHLPWVSPDLEKISQPLHEAVETRFRYSLRDSCTRYLPSNWGKHMLSSF